MAWTDYGEVSLVERGDGADPEPFGQRGDRRDATLPCPRITNPVPLLQPPPLPSLPAPVQSTISGFTQLSGAPRNLRRANRLCPRQQFRLPCSYCIRQEGVSD